VDQVVSGFQKFAAFSRAVAANFFDDECLQSAGALSYTTLLACVPLTAVLVGMTSVFPVFEGLAQQIQNFIFENFVPTTGKVVQGYLAEFSAKTRGLTIFGAAFLFVTAIMMVVTINHAFNRIWKVRRGRSLAGKLLVFWAVLTLGPLLMGLSLGVTSYVISLPVFSDVALPGLRKLVLQASPWGIAMIAFAILYVIVPDRRVKIWHAFVGAAVAATLFELSKWGFARYVTNFNVYETIYGALATIPLFIVWVYLSWLVILLGAEVAFCLRQFSSGERTTGDGPDAFFLACRLLKTLWDSRRQGGVLSADCLLERCPGHSLRDVEVTLSSLVELRLVHRTEGQDWALSRDLDQVSLRALFESRPYSLAGDWQPNDVDPWERKLAHIIGEARTTLRNGMAMSLGELFAGAVGSQAPGTSQEETPVQSLTRKLRS
jgi:membrane protein